MSTPTVTGTSAGAGMGESWVWGFVATDADVCTQSIELCETLVAFLANSSPKAQIYNGAGVVRWTPPVRPTPAPSPLCPPTEAQSPGPASLPPASGVISNPVSHLQCSVNNLQWGH
jgi:hypothetical protein